MPSQMLDDELCWALDEGFFQKVAVADKKRRVKEDVLSALCYQAVFYNAATPWVLLEQVIFASVKQSG